VFEFDTGLGIGEFDTNAAVANVKAPQQMNATVGVLKTKAAISVGLFIILSIPW
jgi:hypothetical protein